MQILDGKQTSLVIQEELTKKVKLLTSKGEKPP